MANWFKLARPMGAAAAATAVAGVPFQQEKTRRWYTGMIHCAQERKNSTAGNKNNHIILTCDGGGTNTRFRLFRVDANQPLENGKQPPGECIKDKKYPTVLFNSFDDCMKTFLDECGCGKEIELPTTAVLALAGTVVNNRVKYTNLSWVVDGYGLRDKMGIARVEVINDFVAQGYGTLTLSDNEVQRPKWSTNVKKVGGAPRCILGAGTGLGECFCVSDRDGVYKCYPSEGGHAEFSPSDLGSGTEQVELLKYLKSRLGASGYNHVSLERVVSGQGICSVYEFLAHNNPEKVDPKIMQDFQADPKNAGIVCVASKGKNADPLCKRSMQLFSHAYGSAAGTLALHFNPANGLYITGGVTSKNFDQLINSEEFKAGFQNKGRMKTLVNNFPIMFVKSEDMGERGAHYRAVSNLKTFLAGHTGRTEEVSDINHDLLPDSKHAHGGSSPDAAALTEHLKEIRSHLKAEKRLG